MQVENIDATQLSKHIINQISKLIDGNQAKAEDVKSNNYSSENIQISLNIFWTFSGIIEKDKIHTGSKNVINHFNYDSKAFEHETNVLLEKAKYDIDLRKEFINTIYLADSDGISYATKEHLIKEFNSFSVFKKCNNCGGSGKVVCYACQGNGNKNCFHCSGSGRNAVIKYDDWNKRNTTYYETCHYCQNGKVRCNNCHGSGKVQCGNCSGYGFFTVIRNISVIAKPNYQVIVSPKSSDYDFQEFIEKNGLDFCNEKIHFSLSSMESFGTDKVHCLYTGKTVVIKQEFSIKAKSYICFGFSYPPYIFIKPYIFDDLFSDEIEFLNKTTNKKDAIGKKQAIEFFDKYSGQPVLDRAIKEIAIHRQASKEETASFVIKSCDEFISEKSAQLLSLHINRFMDKISPPYSKEIWGFSIFIMLLFSIIFIENNFEIAGFDKNVTSLVIVTLAIIFLLSIFSYIFSSLMVLYKRRKIPVEYRQHMRNFEPFLILCKSSLVFFVLFATYGHFANKNIFPKWDSIPLIIVCKITKNFFSYVNFRDNNIVFICNETLENKINNLNSNNGNFVNKNKQIYIVKRAYFYKFPNMDSPKKSCLINGDIVELIDIKKDKYGIKWYYVIYYGSQKNYSGWIKADNGVQLNQKLE